ncbi:MAG TPA: hypothetical protein ENI85_05140 [Deltaproteobacteria bacterium]|nr:hypothetical protein [Deltaproteobacteria bacterium]
MEELEGDERSGSGAVGSGSPEETVGPLSGASGPPEVLSSASSGPGGSSTGTEEGDGARALSLPSVESIRERAQARSEARSDVGAGEEERTVDESLSEARVAAGGRERST